MKIVSRLPSGIESFFALGRRDQLVQERPFAPLTCLLAGVAAERLRAASADVDDGTLAEVIQEVRKKLEREIPGLQQCRFAHTREP
jgi:hypothetical protein